MRALFNSQTKTVHHAAGILIISALLSRVLGIARDWLLAERFGASPELDVYFAVFRIPDFIYHILISGGIIVAFLPLFSEFFSKNQDEAWKFVSNVLNVFLLFLVAFSLVLFIFTPAVVKWITPGFTSSQLEQTIFLTRLMFLSPIFFGLSSIFSGVLQYFRRFLIYSLAPLLYNAGIILGILFLSKSLGVTGIIYGVIFGAFLHLAIQVPSAISCGFRYKPIFDFGGKGLRHIFLLMLPRTLGVAGSQVNLIVMTSIASTLSAGSISIFNLAQNLQNIPINIIGVSFAVAVFAPLSMSLANGAKDTFLKDFSSTFRQVVYIIFPFSLLLFLFRNQIIEIILRHGEFNQISAQLTSASLALFSLGIWAIALIPLISRAFFAFKDTRIPAIVVLATVTLNIILSFYFIEILNSSGLLQNLLKSAFRFEAGQDIRVLGLPLAFAVSGVFQFVLLSFFLYKKIGNFCLGDICGSALKSLAAVLPSAFAAYFFASLVSPAYLQLGIGVLAGTAAYFFATNLLKSPEALSILRRLARYEFLRKK